MKRLIDFAGGRNFVNDDMAAIQEQLDGAYAHLRNKGAFLIEGGAITSAGGGLYNIAAAWLMLNNHVVYMPAMTGVSIGGNTGIKEGTAVQEVSRPFTLLALVKPGVERRIAALVPDLASGAAIGIGEYITLSATAGWGCTLQSILIGQVHSVGDVMYTRTTNINPGGSMNTAAGKGWYKADGSGGSDSLIGVMPVYANMTLVQYLGVSGHGTQ